MEADLRAPLCIIIDTVKLECAHKVSYRRGTRYFMQTRYLTVIGCQVHVCATQVPPLHKRSRERCAPGKPLSGDRLLHVRAIMNQLMASIALGTRCQLNCIERDAYRNGYYRAH